MRVNELIAALEEIEDKSCEVVVQIVGRIFFTYGIEAVKKIENQVVIFFEGDNDSYVETLIERLV